jgi:tRNA G18 (ribose-2'-O)-methylase SpoU
MAEPENLHVVPIDDFADPRVAEYANLRDMDLRSRVRGGPVPLPDGGLFVAEGEWVVQRLVGSRYRTRSVMTNASRLESARPWLATLPPATPVYLVTDALLDRIVGFKFHRGMLAIGEAGPPLSLDAALERAVVAVVLEDTANLDNVGSLFRSVAAFCGVDGRGAVLLNERCCDPLYRKAVRVSMGHVLRVPFTTLAPWPDGLGRLKAMGFTVLALSPRADAESLEEVASTPPARVALLLGAEGPGLTAEAMGAADRVVRIPISADVDSLNVAVAGAIALHQLAPIRS